MRALILAWLLACSSAELDLAKAVVEAEEHEASTRRDLTRLELDLARHDAEIEAASKALRDARTPDEREVRALTLGRLTMERPRLEVDIERQQHKLRDAEVAARKARIHSKQ